MNKGAFFSKTFRRVPTTYRFLEMATWMPATAKRDLALLGPSSVSLRVSEGGGDNLSSVQAIGKGARGRRCPALTNDLGEFRVFDLEPGRYYIAVNYRGEDPFHMDAPTPNQKLNTGYLPSYYPNTVDPAKAQAISVGPGDEIRPIDFFLRTSRFVTVRGRVICAIPGTSAASGGVSLNRQGPGLAQALQGLNDSYRLKDGSFILRNVPPGSYDLAASYRNGI